MDRITGRHSRVQRTDIFLTRIVSILTWANSIAHELGCGKRKTSIPGVRPQKIENIRTPQHSRRACGDAQNQTACIAAYRHHSSLLVITQHTEKCHATAVGIPQHTAQTRLEGHTLKATGNIPPPAAGWNFRGQLSAAHEESRYEHQYSPHRPANSEDPDKAGALRLIPCPICEARSLRCINPEKRSNENEEFVG